MQKDQARSAANNGYTRNQPTKEQAHQQKLAELFAKQAQAKKPAKSLDKAKGDRERGDD